MLGHFEDIYIPAKKMQAIINDVEKTAKAINLVYVSDKQEGICRVSKGETFQYFFNNKKIVDQLTLERIKKLVIPPAWRQVWICSLENGHLQVTGLDARNRKQYKYHSLWNKLRNHTKFYRLLEFGKCMPTIRKQLEKDLALPGMPVEKVLAAVVSVMEQTSIRVGNSLYEKLYGSFGLTTLKNKHVKIAGNQIQFAFKGKKGVAHNISIKSRRLAKIIKQCRDIPGKELFQYYDEEGNHKCIDSGMVNNYIKAISGQDFTAKDFRTWSGTLHAIRAFNEIGKGDTLAELKNNLISVLDRVAMHLGNTRTVCKKYYVHPAILTLYENNKLHTYLDRLDKAKNRGDGEAAGLENLLIHILEQERLICI